MKRERLRSREISICESVYTALCIHISICLRFSISLAPRYAASEGNDALSTL